MALIYESRSNKLEIWVQLGTKEQNSMETTEQLKSCETREVAYTCRYTSGHLTLYIYMSTSISVGIDNLLASLFCCFPAFLFFGP